jgi:phosphoserine phosphatase
MQTSLQAHLQNKLRKEDCNIAYTSAMNTSDLTKKAGSVRAIADELGITHQAVYAWGDKVPEARMFELMGRRPDWFTATKKRKIKPRARK